jgi:hypothetical protein
MSPIVQRSIAIVSALFAFLALPCIPGSAAGITKEPVRLTYEPNRVVVTMAPALRQAIRRRFPGYDLPPINAFDPGLRKGFLLSQPPPGFICAGDFDGNGLPDVALFLKNRRSRWLLAAFHQTYRGTFRPYRLARLEPLQSGFAGWIMRHRPGRLRGFYVTSRGENRDVTVASGRDWIELDDEGATENIGYYFRGGRYRRLELYAEQ